jgi:hypothetical protein
MLLALLVTLALLIAATPALTFLLDARRELSRTYVLTRRAVLKGAK